MTTPFPFVAAQVLTASELNSITNLPSSTKTVSYVLVAGDAGKRIVMNAAGSTTITVNTSLFSAGDVVELSNINTGVCTLTAGTATVSSAGPLAIPQYGGGRLVFTSASAAIYFPSAVTVAAPAASGLTLISSQSISGTSVVFTNCFSATYQNYMVQGSNLVNSSGATPNLRLRLGAGTAHDFNETYYVPNSTGTVASHGTAGNFFAAGQLDVVGNNYQNNFTAFIRSPFLSFRTGYTQFSVGYDNQMRFCNGVETSTTSFTDMTFSVSNGSTVTGSIQIYGYGL